MTRTRFLAAVAVALVFALPASAAAAPRVNKSFFGSVALDGYDAVAYFTDGKPVEGRSEITFEWNGAVWRFATAEHRDLFAADPAKYAPQYGGYCAYGVASGYAVKTEPDAWSVVDGKLYLNYDRSVQASWVKDIPGYIRKADANWPKALAR
jgi:YHS domain-containing protein